ncbi:unnamed protein product, partial [Ectocarpus fasciculatus]
MYILFALIAVLSSAGYHYGPDIAELLRVGSGFTASAVCFGQFVSERELRTITSNEVAGLASYLTSFDIDEQQQSVTAFPRIFIIQEAAARAGFASTSYYLGPDLGCRLSRDPDDISRTRRTMARALSKDIPLPSKPDNRLQKILNYEVSAAAVHTNQTRAIVVVHHGEVVGEVYQSHLGITRDTPLLGWSMTKSVQAMLVGVAIQQGLFDLSTPSKYAQPSTHPCAKSAAITIGDLLVMSDILPFEENYGIHAMVPKMLYATHDAGLFAINTEGGRDDFDGDVHDWYYSSGLTNLLAREIRSYFDSDEAYWKFPQEQLFGPLGISAFALGTDPSGSFIASSFSYATARSWAKLGQLLLQNGRWGDKQLIPEEFVHWIQVPHPYSGGHYGGSFWLNPSRVDNNHFWMTTSLPSDAYFMSGFEGQYTIIIPSLDAVIVRLGFTSEAKNKNWDKSALFGGIAISL